MKMAKRALVVTTCVAWLWPIYCHAEVLTNETVLMMVKAGLGEEVIISKVMASPNQFDVSTAGMLKLKGEGVSEKILQAMIETAGKGESSGRGDVGATTTGLPAGPPVRDPLQSVVSVTNRSSLFVKLPDRVGEILPIEAMVRHSLAKHQIPFYFGPGDNWYYLRGPKAVVRIREKQPAFYTKMNPASFLLVKLTYQTEKDIRYVIATGSAFSNTVPITINKRADESFQLVPSSGLEPGEYAFLSAALFYDFGVE